MLAISRASGSLGCSCAPQQQTLRSIARHLCSSRSHSLLSSEDGHPSRGSDLIAQATQLRATAQVTADPQANGVPSSGAKAKSAETPSQSPPPSVDYNRAKIKVLRAVVVDKLVRSARSGVSAFATLGSRLPCRRSSVSAVEGAMPSTACWRVT